LPVPLGDRLHVHGGAGQIDALGAFQHAAHRAGAFQLVVILVGADEAQHAIFDQHAMANLHIIDEMGIGGADAMVAADNRVALNEQLIAHADRHPAAAVCIFDLPQANFRAAQISQDGNGMLESRRGLADVAQHQQVAVQVTMGEIQATQIGAGLEEGKDDLGVQAGRTHGGENFCADHDHDATTGGIIREMDWMKRPVGFTMCCRAYDAMGLDDLVGWACSPTMGRRWASRPTLQDC